MGKYDRDPENDATTLYVKANYTEVPLSELLEKMKRHFGPEASMDDFTIEAEHINTRCIGYDLYDGADYDNYLVIRHRPA